MSALPHRGAGHAGREVEDTATTSTPPRRSRPLWPGLTRCVGNWSRHVILSHLLRDFAPHYHRCPSSSRSRWCCRRSAQHQCPPGCWCSRCSLRSTEHHAGRRRWDCRIRRVVISRRRCRLSDTWRRPRRLREEHVLAIVVIRCDVGVWWCGGRLGIGRKVRRKGTGRRCDARPVSAIGGAIAVRAVPARSHATAPRLLRGGRAPTRRRACATTARRLTPSRSLGPTARCAVRRVPLHRATVYIYGCNGYSHISIWPCVYIYSYKYIGSCTALSMYSNAYKHIALGLYAAEM